MEDYTEPVMQRPFLIHKDAWSDLILSPDELIASVADGKINPGTAVIDQRTGSQFPACLLNEPFIQKNKVFGRPCHDRLPEDDNSGLY